MKWKCFLVLYQSCEDENQGIIRHSKTGYPDLNRSLFPTVDPRVEVSGDEHVNVRVQGREETPVHGEDLADVPGGRVVPHVADVEAGVAAGEVTQ